MTTDPFTETFGEKPWERDPGPDGPSDPAGEGRRTSLLGRLLSFQAFMEQEDVPCEDMLGPLLARGHRMLLAADTGHGKTTFATWMTRSLTCGTPFLKGPGFKGILPGWMRWAEDDPSVPERVGDPYRVLIVDCEQSQRTVKKRLSEAGLEGIGDSHYWRIAEGVDLARDGIDRRVVGEVLTDLRPDVVLVDPLFKLHRGNPNDSEVAAQVMAAVDFWRDELRFGLIIPVHVRKQPSMNGKPTRDLTLSDVHGAATWTWGAEVILGLERRREKRQGVSGLVDRTYLRWFKDREGDLFETTWELSFDRASGYHRQPDGGKGGRPALGDTVAQVRQFLELQSFESGNVDRWWSVREITEALGRSSPGPIGTALKTLGEEAGLPASDPEHWPLLQRRVPAAGGRTLQNEFRYGGDVGQRALVVEALPALAEISPDVTGPVDPRTQRLRDLGMDDDEDLGGI